MTVERIRAWLIEHGEWRDAVHAPLRQGLTEWRIACGGPDGEAFVFPAADGDVWQLHAGRHSVIEIARQLGHSPTMTLNTSGHVMISEWAIQDSNLGPLPYQRSALTD